MSISVQQSDCKVLISIDCKDSHQAEQVAVKVAADVNSGKFDPLDDAPKPKEKPAAKKKDD